VGQLNSEVVIVSMEGARERREGGKGEGGEEGEGMGANLYEALRSEN